MHGHLASTTIGVEWTFTCKNSKYSLHQAPFSFHITLKENCIYGVNRAIGCGHSAAERLMSVICHLLLGELLGLTTPSLAKSRQ